MEDEFWRALYERKKQIGDEKYREGYQQGYREAFRKAYREAFRKAYREAFRKGFQESRREDWENALNDLVAKGILTKEQVKDLKSDFS